MGVLEIPKVLYLGYWNTPGCATPDVLHALDLQKKIAKIHCAQQDHDHEVI